MCETSCVQEPARPPAVPAPDSPPSRDGREAIHLETGHLGRPDAEHRCPERPDRTPAERRLAARIFISTERPRFCSTSIAMNLASDARAVAAAATDQRGVFDSTDL